MPSDPERTMSIAASRAVEELKAADAARIQQRADQMRREGGKFVEREVPQITWEDKLLAHGRSLSNIMDSLERFPRSTRSIRFYASTGGNAAEVTAMVRANQEFMKRNPKGALARQGLEDARAEMIGRMEDMVTTKEQEAEAMKAFRWAEANRAPELSQRPGEKQYFVDRPGPSALEQPVRTMKSTDQVSPEGQWGDHLGFGHLEQWGEELQEQDAQKWFDERDERNR
jgi:hypothetical protein